MEPTMLRKDRPPALASLQAGRAIAAILVVFFHINTEIFNGGRYWAEIPAFSVLHFGYIGVEYFFVLSGFIVYFIHKNDIGNRSSFMSFMKKRFTRVYPTYWIILVALVISGLLFPTLAGASSGGIKNFLSSFFLVAISTKAYSVPTTILVVGWTLFHEILFYVVFSILIINTIIGSAVAATWLVGSVVLLYSSEPTLLSVYFAPIHLLFAIGVLSGWLYLKGEVSRPATLTAVGVLALVVVLGMLAFEPASIPWRFQSILIGIPAGFLLLGTACLERAGRIKVSSILSFLGDASYSIYIVHLPLLILLTKIVWAGHLERVLPPAVWYTILPAVTIGIACVFHLQVERRILNATRRIQFGTLFRRQKRLASASASAD
jgi:exopolysaccharide production protein ExoZ